MTSTIEDQAVGTLAVGTRVTTTTGIGIGTVLGTDAQGQVYLCGRPAYDGSAWRLARCDRSQVIVDDSPTAPGPTLEDVGRLYIQKQELMEQNLATVREVRAELEAYKEKVRTIALEFKAEENWCDEGFNRAMDALGLEGVERDYEVTIEVTAIQTVSVTVSASSEEQAQEYVEQSYRNSDVMDQASNYDWEIENWEVSEVNEA